MNDAVPAPDTPPDVTIEIIGAVGGSIGGNTPLQIRLTDRSPQLDRSMTPIPQRVVTVTGPEGEQEVTLTLDRWAHDPNDPAVYVSSGTNNLNGLWHAPEWTERPLIGGSLTPERREPIEFDDGDTITFSAQGASTSVVAREKHNDFVLDTQEMFFNNSLRLFVGLLDQHRREGDRSDPNYRQNEQILEDAVATTEKAVKNHRDSRLTREGQIRSAHFYIAHLPFDSLQEFLRGGDLEPTYSHERYVIGGSGVTNTLSLPEIRGAGVRDILENVESNAYLKGKVRDREVILGSFDTLAVDLLKGGYEYVVKQSGIDWVIPLINNGKDHTGKKLTPGDWAVLATGVALKGIDKGRMALGRTALSPIDSTLDLTTAIDRGLHQKALDTFTGGVEKTLTGRGKAIIDQTLRNAGLLAPKKPAVRGPVSRDAAAVDPEVAALVAIGRSQSAAPVTTATEPQEEEAFYTAAPGASVTGMTGEGSSLTGSASIADDYAEPPDEDDLDALDGIEVVEDPPWLLEDEDDLDDVGTSADATRTTAMTDTAAEHDVATDRDLVGVGETVAETVSDTGAEEVPEETAATAVFGGTHDWLEPLAAPPAVTTSQQRDVLQQVYAGAEAPGLHIAGIAMIDEVDNDGRTTLTVRVGETGRLLPRREDTDKPAASLLRLQVYPDRQNGGWIANAWQLDVARGHTIAANSSGATPDELKALQGGRVYEEYLNDEDYKAAIRDSIAKTPSEAVTQALRPLVGGADTLVRGRAETPPPQLAGQDPLVGVRGLGTVDVTGVIGSTGGYSRDDESEDRSWTDGGTVDPTAVAVRTESADLDDTGLVAWVKWAMGVGIVAVVALAVILLAGGGGDESLLAGDPPGAGDDAAQSNAATAEQTPGNANAATSGDSGLTGAEGTNGDDTLVAAGGQDPTAEGAGDPPPPPPPPVDEPPSVESVPAISAIDELLRSGSRLEGTLTMNPVTGGQGFSDGYEATVLSQGLSFIPGLDSEPEDFFYSHALAMWMAEGFTDVGVAADFQLIQGSGATGQFTNGAVFVVDGEGVVLTIGTDFGTYLEGYIFRLIPCDGFPACADVEASGFTVGGPPELDVAAMVTDLVHLYSTSPGADTPLTQDYAWNLTAGGTLQWTNSLPPNGPPLEDVDFLITGLSSAANPDGTESVSLSLAGPVPEAPERFLTAVRFTLFPASGGRLTGAWQFRDGNLSVFGFCSEEWVDTPNCPGGLFDVEAAFSADRREVTFAFDLDLSALGEIDVNGSVVLSDQPDVANSFLFLPEGVPFGSTASN